MVGYVRRILAWLEQWIPDAFFEGEEVDRLRRARLAVRLGAVGVVTGVVFTVGQVLSAAYLPALGTGVLTACCAGVWMLLHRTASLRATAHGYAGAVFVDVVYQTYHMGGIASPGVAWFLLVPVLAGMIGGYRVGAQWLPWSALIIVAFGVAALAGVECPNSLHDETSRIANQVLAPVLLVLGLYAVVGSYESATHEALQRTHAERERANRANRAKSDFLANMSHEIRTPMTAILGFVDVLDHAVGVDPGAARRASATIRNNATQLLGVLNEILDVSKIEAGQMTTERIPTDPVRVTRSVLDIMEAQADGKGLDLGMSLEGPLPMYIPSDPTRLRQVLLNLVGNAVKFTQEGGVTVSMSMEGARLRFSVSDTGIGMNADQLAKIRRFDTFSQADTSTTRKFGGTGLGLHISHALVQLLGGKLEVTSTAGLGSTFSFCVASCTADLVDRAGMESNDEFPAQTRPAASGDLPSLEGLHILVAEDGPDNRVLLEFHLTRAGAEVSFAHDGVEAVAWLAEHEADLVLMDMQMPNLDGYQATRRLRSAGITTPIVALTAHAMSGARAECIEAGCDDYLTKPLDRDALIGMCDRLGRCPNAETVG